MAKLRAWKPSADQRIGWDHTFIKITQMAPGYLVQELFGYADTTWEKWLCENRAIVKQLNRRPWIKLELLGQADCVERGAA